MAEKAVYKKVATAPIKSIDETVRVTEKGYEYYIARLKDEVKGNTLHIGGATWLSAETVEEFGIDKLIGKRVSRYEKV